MNSDALRRWIAAGNLANCARPSFANGRLAAQARASVREAVAAVVFVPFLVAALAGCEARDDEVPESPAEEARLHCSFVDITTGSGIDYVHMNSASPERLLPETMGAGAAFFDYDRDGLPDLYLVGGGVIPGASPRGDASGSDSGAGAQESARRNERSTGALYRNLGGGRFEDVTQASGLAHSFYGMGAAVGDIDGDGWLDLIVTALGKDHLYRNRGDGTFEDVSAKWGLPDTGFTTSAAFVDYDRDGRLDLFLCRYVEWSPESDIECRPDGIHRIYCTPEAYPATSNLLFRNTGDGFEDVSHRSGIDSALGKALGVVPIDHDGDGWADLVVANDTVRNFLFRNRGDGTFEEIGAIVGIAYSESGAPRGGMGIDAGDLDEDGYTDVVVTNFTHEMVALFRGSSTGRYLDDAPHLGLGFPTLLTLGFGVLVEDFDLDGALDVLIANGHIEPDIAEIQRGQSYAQKPQLFYGDGDGRLTPDEGADTFPEPLVGRGLAAADIDADGDLDVLFTQNGRGVRLYRNDSPPHHWLRVGLVSSDTAAPVATYGATVEVTAGGEASRKALVSGRSYLSASEPVLTFGLGADATLDSVVVVWPDGTRTRADGASVDRVLVVDRVVSAQEADR
ncbi:MAG: CRTAC1 family protein [Candidatus Eisenbacteria bacterium]|uniref:CRTAC1 family protein n=1 Tax=Eiseniibacteriota bacterium TaxID=2212470 RepID=A0A956NBZ7_UNCEI|nr:CRTAC1 family protein [Candidatus Eisenbacteria bacterium]